MEQDGLDIGGLVEELYKKPLRSDVGDKNYDFRAFLKTQLRIYHETIETAPESLRPSIAEFVTDFSGAISVDQFERYMTIMNDTSEPLRKEFQGLVTQLLVMKNSDELNTYFPNHKEKYFEVVQAYNERRGIIALQEVDSQKSMG